MAFYDSGTRYDSAARYDEAPQPPTSPKKRTATVKLDLQNRDDDDLVNFARTHITKLAENAADFPDPDPNVADFLAPERLV